VTSIKEWRLRTELADDGSPARRPRVVVDNVIAPLL